MRLVISRRVAATAVAVAALWPATAAAQEGLVLAVSTPDRPVSDLRVEGISLFDGKLLEPQLGAQVSVGRLTMIGAFDVPPAIAGAPPAARHAEWLAHITSSSTFHIAAGSGVRHEAGGVDVMLGRVVADLRAAGGRLTGNLLVEHALGGGGRDAADLITNIGWTHAVGRGVHLGAEIRAEDVEGFWSTEEAEGGARLFVGPAIVVQPRRRRWTLRATAGRDVQATRSMFSGSGAERIISTSGGFAARVAFNRSF